MFRFVFIVLCFTIFSFSREQIRPEYEINDSVLSLVYKFRVSNIGDEELLRILFNFEKVKEYSAKTNIKITLIEENEETNKILYEYNYLVAKLGMEMFRQKFKEQKKVIFRMEKYERSAKIIPDILSVGGSYEIIENNTVLYKQQTVMDREIKGIYAMLIKRDVQGYLKEITKYIDERTNVR